MLDAHRHAQRGGARDERGQQQWLRSGDQPGRDRLQALSGRVRALLPGEQPRPQREDGGLPTRCLDLVDTEHHRVKEPVDLAVQPEHLRLVSLLTAGEDDQRHRQHGHAGEDQPRQPRVYTDHHHHAHQGENRAEQSGDGDIGQAATDLGDAARPRDQFTGGVPGEKGCAQGQQAVPHGRLQSRLQPALEPHDGRVAYEQQQAGSGHDRGEQAREPAQRTRAAIDDQPWQHQSDRQWNSQREQASDDPGEQQHTEVRPGAG